jgi:hypothetical protein
MGLTFKVVDERGTKMVWVACTHCGHPMAWNRGSLLEARDHGAKLTCADPVCIASAAPVSREMFDRALKLLDEAERIGEFMATWGDRAASAPVHGWSFRARLEDIDIARICHEADEAGLECIEVGCPRSPDIGTRVLITRRLLQELRNYPHAINVDYLGCPRGIRRGIECIDGVDSTRVYWYEEGLYEWVQFIEHGEPVTATRAAELLHAMRTLRDEHLRCVVRAVVPC